MAVFFMYPANVISSPRVIDYDKRLKILKNLIL